MYRFFVFASLLTLSVLTHVEATGCDEKIAAFAPVCCPLTDPIYAAFCERLTRRDHYTSTGKVEAEEAWIGNYDIAEGIAVPKDKYGSSPADIIETSTNTADPSTIAPTLNQEDSAVNTLTDSSKAPSMAPSEAPSIAPSEAPSASSTEKAACDDLEAAFAPVCCSPPLDPSFADFCGRLFSRLSYNSSGIIEQQAEWIGHYDIVGELKAQFNDHHQ